MAAFDEQPWYNEWRAFLLALVGQIIANGPRDGMIS